MATSDEVEVARSDEEDSAPAPEFDLTRSDERVLQYLADNGADYPALIAGNTGLHIPLVERSVESMVDAGLVEQVSKETVYRITTAGRDAVGE